jgi:hypothetical protein
VTVHRDKFPYNKTNQMHYSQIYFGMKLYIFRTGPLSTISSYSLYTQQWYMSYRFVDSFRAAAAGSGCSILLEHPDPAAAAARKLSTNLYDIYHC